MEVKDCVRGMMHIFNTSTSPINLYNLGSHDTCSVRRIAEIVVEETGCRDATIEYTGGDRGWAGDVPKTWLNVDKLYSSGFQPEMNSEEAVRWCAESLGL